MAYIKHIIIINQYIGSPYHGMEYRHYYLAKNLIALGYKVTLVSGSYSHLFSSLPQVEKSFTKEYIDQIDYIWIKTPHYKSSKSIGRMWNMFYFSWKLNFLKNIEPGHIIVSSPSLFPIKNAYKLAKKFKTKLLFEIRDIWPLTLVELSGLNHRNPLIKLMKHYEKFAYRNADKVISLLPTAKEYFVMQGMPSNKFVYLPNGMEIEDTEPSPLPANINIHIPKEKFIVAYTGTVGQANNLDYLVEVADTMKKDRDIHFIILGQGGEKKKLQEKAEKLKLKNITFMAAVQKEMVQSFLKRIDIAFISLLPENLFRFGVSPNKVFEYMYAKKPIIWAIEAGNNLVEEAKCGISVPLNNPVKLKESILELQSLTKREREALGQNGYNFVRMHHDYYVLAKKLMKIIEE